MLIPTIQIHVVLNSLFDILGEYIEDLANI